MAAIYPFRAWRYNPGSVRLADVVTQPYDKISPAMQQAYYGSSPYNLVRIVFGLPELFDAERHESVYSRAARDFASWREQGVLLQEKTPCMFAYAQKFQVPGSSAMLERRGFIALGKLHDYEDRVVFRHEQTLSKPKSDRLNLLKATRAHFGQIFMLYSDPAGSVERILYDGNGAADAEVTDEYGVLHSLWRINDPAAIKLLVTEMADKKLIIADGHHRYETALAYAKEQVPIVLKKTEYSTRQLPCAPNPEAAAMMTFINMDAGGLVILPTHRVVHGLQGFDPQQFIRRASEFFAVEPLPVQEPAVYLEQLGQTPGTAFIAVTSAGTFLLMANEGSIEQALSGISERQRRLDLTQLHAVILERLLGLDSEKIREQSNIRYLRDAAEAIEQVRRADADVAFLTNPVTLDQLKEVAFAGEVMPQKSTDFYPKLLSGLTIYAMD